MFRHPFDTFYVPLVLGLAMLLAGIGLPAVGVTISHIVAWGLIILALALIAIAGVMAYRMQKHTPVKHDNHIETAPTFDNGNAVINGENKDPWNEIGQNYEYHESTQAYISNRLNHLLEEINTERYEKIRPSHIAQRLGAERAEEVEEWFFGKNTPTFAQLLAISKLFGVEANWLQHGDGHIFPVRYKHLPRNPIEAVTWLMNWEDKENEIYTLHLIRTLDAIGSLCLIKESKYEHFYIYHTQIHVSDMIGASGEADLMHLFVTLEFLYQQHVNGGSRFSVEGHQLEREDISLLMKGDKNPKYFLNKGRSTWWEDIWDQEIRNDYWPGYHSLRDRVERRIAQNTRLIDWRKKIRDKKITINHGVALSEA